MRVHTKPSRIVGNRKGPGTILISALLVLTVFMVAASNLAVNPVLAASSPPLGAAQSYSVLGGSSVTCTGATHVTGDVGVSPGTSITGFPSPCSVGPPGTTHNNDASAIAAQAATLTAFGALTQTCDHSYASGQDLTLISPLGPGVYCSAGSFLMTGTLTLAGSGIWIFRTVSSLITSPNSKVLLGDPCNVWWQVGSQATIDTNTQFIGNILASAAVVLNSGATFNGRALAQSGGAITLNGNAVSGPTCASATTSTVITVTSPIGTSTTVGGGTSTTFTTFFTTVTGVVIIPEYPWGVFLLLILMLPAYMLLKRRNRTQ
jgi:hypothetical protein